MPANDALGGLSDFNLPQPSQSNSTAPSPLADLLGNQVMDELGKTRQISAQLDQLRSGEGDQTFLQRLLSPRGLLPLLLAGGAAAAGRPGVAAGLGIGGLQGINQAEEAERSQRNKAMEDLNKQLDKSLDRQDKSRNRFIQLLQSQPDMFLDEEGRSTIDARVLGWYATGAPIPLFPETRRILDQRDEGWDKVNDVLYKALQEAKSPEQARVITNNLLRHTGMDEVPADLTDAIVGSFGTPEFNDTMARLLVEYGGPSGLDALIFAGENQLPNSHPEVLKMVQFQPKDTTPSQQLNARFLGLMDEVNNWQQNPANTQEVLQIQAEAGNDIGGATREIANRALTGRNADISFFLDKDNVPEGLTTALVLRSFSTVTSKEKMVDAIRGVSDLSRKKELSDEQLLTERGANTLRLIEELRQNVAKAQGNRDAGLRNTAAISISDAIPGAGLNQVYAIVDDIFAKALADSRTADGEVDRAKFEATIEAYTKQAIEQLK